MLPHKSNVLFKGTFIRCYCCYYSKTRTNQVLVSNSIEVVEPSDAFVPSSSIWLCDFDNIIPAIVEGNPSGAGAAYEAGMNLSRITGAFGSYYTVKLLWVMLGMGFIKN